MIYILNIETATKKCSVAVSKNNELIACREVAEEQFSHAEKLHVFIEEVMAEAQLQLTDLNAVAVSKGPGSYTGLRIGVSSAKGLCYALNIPLISVDTLAILAYQIAPEEGSIQPMIDARRMEVFTQQFDRYHTATGKAYALIVDETAFAGEVQKIHLLGDGAVKCQAVLNDDRFVYYPENIYPSAKDMIALSFEKYKKNDIEDVAYFEPFYLKDFQLNK